MRFDGSSAHIRISDQNRWPCHPYLTCILPLLFLSGQELVLALDQVKRVVDLRLIRRAEHRPMDLHRALGRFDPVADDDGQSQRTQHRA